MKSTHFSIEKDIEAYLTRTVNARGGMCIKVVPDHCTGLPDRLVLLPNGEAVFVEVKDTKGKLSERQAYMLKKLNELGVKALVIRTKEDINQLFL